MPDKTNSNGNIKMEPFFRTLRIEEVYLGVCNTLEDVLFSIRYFNQEVYK